MSNVLLFNQPIKLNDNGTLDTSEYKKECIVCKLERNFPDLYLSYNGEFICRDCIPRTATINDLERSGILKYIDAKAFQ